MIPKKILIYLVLFAFVSPVAAQKPNDKRLQGLDTLVNKVLKDWKAPGIAICIVEKNKVIYAGGFGYRDLEKKLPVTGQTLFAIGSCTKAFTASTLGMLAKEGKVDIDQPVIRYLPELKFKNEYTTNHVNLRDMMCHRTGLPRHDLSWYGSSATREELLNRIPYLQPTAELRQAWQYNNFMFMVQGIVIERLTGKSWEENITERILKPLGMSHTKLSIGEMEKSEDHSLAYTLENDSIISAIPYRNIDAIGPAGSINSCAEDMAKWLMTWIYGGQFNGTEIIPAGFVKQAMVTQMATGGGLPGPEFPDVHGSGYGLGWGISSYRGHYRVEHGGGIDGFISSTCFFPADSLGIFVVSDQGGPTSVIRNLLVDRMLKLPYRNWNQYLLGIVRKEQMQKKLETESKDLNRVPNTKPSHDLSAYTGTFADSGYGTIEITLANDTLYGSFNSFKLALKHYHYDQFEARIQNEKNSDIGPVKMQFLTDSRGAIEKVLIPWQTGADDIEFIRQVKAPDLDESALQKYTGEYVLGPQKITISVRNQKELWAVVSGQPDYLLEPSGKDEFRFKILKGYTVRFEANQAGDIIAAYFIQPNGTYKATKKK